MTTRRYAEGTQVPIDRSKQEIDRLLRNHGAKTIVIGEEVETSNMFIDFTMRNRKLRFIVRMPAFEEFRYTPKRRHLRNVDQQSDAHQAECRRRARSLLISIKAKFEAVESGVEMFEEAFLAQIVLPEGDRVGDQIIPQIAQQYEALGTGESINRLQLTSGE